MISTRHVARLGKLVCLVPQRYLQMICTFVDRALHYLAFFAYADMHRSSSRQVFESYVTSQARHGHQVVQRMVTKDRVLIL